MFDFRHCISAFCNLNKNKKFLSGLFCLPFLILLFTANFPTIASFDALQRFDPVALNITVISEEEIPVRIVQLRPPGSASDSPLDAEVSLTELASSDSRPLSGDTGASAERSEQQPGAQSASVGGLSNSEPKASGLLPATRVLSAPSEGVQQLLASLERVERRPHMFDYLEETLHSSPDYLTDLRSIFRMLRESYSAISTLTNQVEILQIRTFLVSFLL